MSTYKNAQKAKFPFSAIREGDELKFATDDENERNLWVQALYRATGQAYKPVPPKQSVMATKTQGFQDKASKHGKFLGKRRWKHLGFCRT